jgi:hypothetical protein
MQGCQNGACRAWTCTPGTAICEGTAVARCNADGFTRATTPCPSVTNGAATCTAGTCGATCNTGYVLQAGACVAAGTAVRPLAPLSPSRVGPRPTFAWQAPSGMSASVEVCADRPCTRIEATVSGSGSARVTTALRNGVHYWRVRSASGVSTVWEFFVSPRVTEAANVRGPAVDLDGDGYQDLYVAAPGSPQGGLTFYGRAADLDVAPLRVIGCSAPQSAADLNGDGYGDVACANTTGSSVFELRVLFGGAARPTTAQSATGLTAQTFAAGFDVTGDGYGDVVAVVNRALRVYEGSPTGLVRSTLPDIAAPPAVADIFGGSVALVGDMDGDGYPEVAVGSRSPDNMRGQVDIYRGLPRGFASTPLVTIGRPGGGTGSMGSRVLRLGDVNGDGLADLGVFAGQSLIAPGIYVFVGVRGGAASATPWYTGTGFALESLVGDGDLNGDGYDDVVMQTNTNGTGVVASRGGASTLTGFAVFDATMPPNYYFGTILHAAHDLDGDGFDDVAVRDAVLSDHPGRVHLYRGGAAPVRTPWKILDGRALGVTGAYPGFGIGIAMSLGRWRFCA